MKKFLQICIKTLDELAPQKKKYSRGNNSSFINKTIKKAFMTKSRLRNTYLKNLGYIKHEYVNITDGETITYLF